MDTKVTNSESIALVDKVKSPGEMRKGILKVEAIMSKMEGAVFGDNACPLKHTFGDGCYIREITMPRGMLIVSKIHKVKHPYFILKGKVSVLTEEGVVKLQAPYSGITPAGTKRILYIHEETVWTTVHITKETDLKKIEEQIIAKDFGEAGITNDEILKIRNFVTKEE